MIVGKVLRSFDLFTCFFTGFLAGFSREGDGPWGYLAFPISLLVNLNPCERVGPRDHCPFESERIIHGFVPYYKVLVKASVTFAIHVGSDLGDNLIPFIVIYPLHMLLWIDRTDSETVCALLGSKCIVEVPPVIFSQEGSSNEPGDLLLWGTTFVKEIGKFSHPASFNASLSSLSLSTSFFIAQTEYFF